MSSETPIIFIGEGEAREIVEKSECGLTVSPDDIDGVANSIINMIKSVNLRKFYGKNGRKKVLEDYNRKNILKILKRN